MVKPNDIRELAKGIAREFHPERVVLFGSYAEGTATPDSDVDLLVVMPFRGTSLRMSVAILNHLDVRFPVDLVARRPADVRRRYAEGDPLIREALDRGKVLYERHG
jgi:uncharacterized protein